MTNQRNSSEENSQKMNFTSFLKKLLIVAGWLFLWLILAIVIDNKFILVTPIKALIRLFELASSVSFWNSVFGSMLRIFVGFLSGFILALLLAALCFRHPLLEDILAPLINLFTSVPVAVFTVLILIWFGKNMLVVLICFMVVLPICYKNTLEGLKSVDIKIQEMAGVYGINSYNKFFFIYRPALRPFLESGLSLSLGMCWKAGIAAEVIGTPTNSIGNNLYMSKIYLDTAGIFAWAAVVVMLSFIFKKLMETFIHSFFTWTIKPMQNGRVEFTNDVVYNKTAASKVDGIGNIKSSPALEICNISKYYGEKAIFKAFSEKYEYGKKYYFSSPSGSGKTTLFRCISGLETIDDGSIIKGETVSFMFQEDRLCEDYDAVTNVYICAGKNKTREKIRTALLKLLDEADIEKPCSQLSGGMKRRVALVRAIECGCNIILLDEPFTGMDDETMKKVKAYIDEETMDKCVLIATHI